MSILDNLLPHNECQMVRSDSLDARMFTELREQSGNLQKESLRIFPPFDTGYIELTFLASAGDMISSLYTHHSIFS